MNSTISDCPRECRGMRGAAAGHGVRGDGRTEGRLLDRYAGRRRACDRRWRVCPDEPVDARAGSAASAIRILIPKPAPKPAPKPDAEARAEAEAEA